MKAILKGRVVAESDDIVERDGYQYFLDFSCSMDFNTRQIRRVDVRPR